MESSEFKVFKKSSKYGIYLRFSLKLLSIIVDIFYIKKIPSNLLGLSNIRLGLLYSTVVSLCRDPFRKTLISEKYSPMVTNLSFICPLIGLPLSVILSLIWITFLTPSSSVISFSTYGICCLVYTFGSILELLQEPAFLFLKTQDYILSLTFLEVSAQIFHTSILLIIINVYDEITIYIITFVHISRIFVVLLSHWVIVLYYKPSFLPQFSYWKDMANTIQGNDKIPLIVSFAKQNVLQQLLAQGENYIINILPWMNLSDQGYYSVVSNLGSIIPHVIFAPIEEAFYILCGRKLTRVLDSKRTNTQFLTNIYWPIQRIMLYLGIVAAIYGQLYSDTFFTIFFSHTFHSTATLAYYMKLFAIYIFFLSLNGISEALTYSTLNPNQINSRNRVLITISFIHFALLTITTYYLSVTGLIIANITSNTIRIFISFVYIKRFFKITYLNVIRNLTPPKQVIGSLLISYLIISRLSLLLHSILPITFILHEFYVQIFKVILGVLSLIVNVSIAFKYDNNIMLILKTDLLQSKKE